MLSPTGPIAAILGVGVLAIAPLLYDGTQALNAPKPELMQVVLLDVIDGMVHQGHFVSGKPNMPAPWAGSMEVDGKVVCSGSSNGAQASYVTNFRTPGVYSSVEWTGDQSCPIKAKDADALIGTWEYVTEDGLKVSITARRDR